MKKIPNYALQLFPSAEKILLVSYSGTAHPKAVIWEGVRLHMKEYIGSQCVCVALLLQLHSLLLREGEIGFKPGSRREASKKKNKNKTRKEDIVKPSLK